MRPITKGARLLPSQPESRGIYRFSEAQYQRLEQDGVFSSEKVELLDGYLVFTDPASRPPTALASPLPLPPDIASLSLYTFSVEQYQKMEQVGVFGSDRVELLDGYV